MQQLMDILYPFSDELHVITGGAARHISAEGKPGAHLYFIDQEPAANSFVRVVNNISTQLKISWRLRGVAPHVDFWFFFFGGPVLLLPMLTAKLLRKDVVLVLTGSASAEIAPQMGRFVSHVVSLISKINCSLSKRIVVYSESLIKAWGLEKYGHKMSVARRHYLYFDKFKTIKPLRDRDNVIGYVGRLSQEKGISNLMEAVPKVIEARDDVVFLIAGDGQLRNEVEARAAKANGRVRYVGWIPHDELPYYLNEFKLLVIPSHTESGPATAFEAMACGTPVLATAVGSIPDVIKDGETGFIMESNSPQCIAQNVVRALNHPDLEQITLNARNLVEKEFTYEAAVERYRKILQSLG